MTATELVRVVTATREIAAEQRGPRARATAGTVRAPIGPLAERR